MNQISDMTAVVCAIIQNENKILIAQRSEEMSLPLKWEFPGGKVEENEDKKAVLKREITKNRVRRFCFLYVKLKGQLTDLLRAMYLLVQLNM